MVLLKHPVSGHEVRTDEASVDFWRGAGYRDTPKAPAKKAASPKKSSK